MKKILSIILAFLMLMFFAFNLVSCDTNEGKGHSAPDGLTPFIGENGNWWIGDSDTGVKAEASDGADGKNGVDGRTPNIRVNADTGEWEYSFDGEKWISLGVKITDEKEKYSQMSVAFVGDSITEGLKTDKIYHEYLNEYFGFKSVTVQGISGSCISATSDYKNLYTPLINRYNEIPEDADMIFIFMGTNDYGHDTPLGTIDDCEDVSFYGALNVIIPSIINSHPNSRIVVITPLHRYGMGKSAMTGVKHTYDYLPNGRGHSLGDYVNALREVCERWSVPVIDLYAESGLNPAVPNIKEAFMPDGLHPNAAGHYKIAEIIKNYIKLFAVDNKISTVDSEES